MLTITLPQTELYNEETQEFIYTKELVITLEHSLISLSKWESDWKKPFLTKTPKTNEETLDYIRCMILTQNVPSSALLSLNNGLLEQISAYIYSPMTATTFSKEETPISREIITSEIIYYWMIAFNIPFECQKWHLNRLLTLIKICNIKNQPPKKMGKKAAYNRNSAINAARRQQYNTNG